jgi:hypothetical protein
MTTFISSSLIREKPWQPVHVGQGCPAWMSSMGPLRNASATIAFASLVMSKNSIVLKTSGIGHPVPNGINTTMLSAESGAM